MEKRLREIVQKVREDFQVPSISVSVYHNGKTTFINEGFSNVEKEIPASEDTIYAIASVSKSFIATALCILVDDGKLSLDDPVRKYFPAFTLHEEYITNHLTIRDALGHRSGLPRHDMMWFHQSELSLYEIIDRLQHLPVAFPPRTRMHYQNHMFALASVLVEKITGGCWQGFVKERILDPLGMTATFTDSRKYRGQGWQEESVPYGIVDNVVQEVAYFRTYNTACSGCIHSTTRDLDKWVRLHLGKGEFEGKRIYSEEMAKHLHGPQMIIKQGEMFPYDFAEIDFTSYGQGWFIESYRGEKLVHHGGTIDGFKSLAGFLPNKGIGFSILTNLSNNQAASALGYYICDLALELSEIDWSKRFQNFMSSLEWKNKEIEAAYEAKSADAPPLTHSIHAYTGKYTHPGYGTYTIEQADGKLFMTIAGEKLPLTHIGYNQFYTKFTRFLTFLSMRFDYDESGEINNLSVKFDPIVKAIPLNKQKT